MTNKLVIIHDSFQKYFYPCIHLSQETKMETNNRLVVLFSVNMSIYFYFLFITKILHTNFVFCSSIEWVIC